MDDIIEDVASNTNIFYFCGAKHSLWSGNDAVVSAANDTPETQYSFNNEILFGKRVYANNFAYMVKRNLWESNTIYDHYDHRDPDLFDKKFFVVNSTNKVYKCLFNNGDNPSVDEPTQLTTNNFTTSDGYIWKYMYTISATNSQFFYTEGLVPVDVNTTVTSAASNGSIDIIIVDSSGSGYLTTSNGFVTNAVSSTLISIDPNASSQNYFYNNADMYIIGGAGAGQIATISNYIVNSSGKYVTTSSALVGLDPTSEYRIAPKVVIEGDGTGATAYCVIDTSSNNYGVQSINMINRGSNYSFANAYIVANSLYGSGATVSAIVAPPGGHGSNVVEELGASALGCAVYFANTESNTISIDLEFRQSGIIINPKKYSNTAQSYTSSTLSGLTELDISVPGSQFINREPVVGLSSNATGMVVFGNSSYMSLSNVIGTFVTGETVSGNSSGAVGVISDITFPDIARNNHKLLYVDNFEYVQRANNSTESIKLFINF